jgi:membrane protein DedA with SNARE-associated domain
MLEALGVVDRFGYFGVAGLVFIESFGVPAPGETAIIAGSAYAGRGHLDIVAVAVSACLAAVLGDCIGYVIGRRAGRPFILRIGRYIRLTPERLDRVEGFMARHGPKMVVIARFVEGLRQFNGIVAGMTRMPFPTFVACNALGAALWVGCWSTAGYLAGNNLEAITVTVGRYLTVAIAMATLILAAYAWHRRRRRARVSSSDSASGPPSAP